MHLLAAAAAAGSVLVAPAPHLAATAPADAAASEDELHIPEGFELAFGDDFEDGHAEGWLPKAGTSWTVDENNGTHVYHLLEPGPQGRLRAPGAYALIADQEPGSFVLTARAKCLTPPDVQGRDVVVTLGYQDPEHFYYVHFSNLSDALHNAILKVDGADRAPLTPTDPQRRAGLTTDDYDQLKVEFDAARGEITAFIDDMVEPIMSVQDRTFDHGAVGIGSFDDTAMFDDVKLFLPGR